jgi:hypothetical protein
LGFNLNSSTAIKVFGCVVEVPEIEELEANVSIYPNPASDKMYIDFGELRTKKVSIELYDIVGKKVQLDITNNNYNNKYEIDLNNCSNGFYLVNINVDGNQITKKVLIQK